MRIHVNYSSARFIFFIVSLFLSLTGIYAAIKGSDAVYVSVLFHISFAPLYFLFCIWQFYLTDKYFLTKKFYRFAIIITASILLLAAVVTFATSNNNLFPRYLDFFGNLLSVVFITCVAAILRYSKNKLTKEAEMAEYKSARNEAEIKLLKQQINPHFLFNTLNSIYLKCLENKEEAGAMVMYLSDLLRYQLEQGNSETVSIKQELDFIANYIYFEQRRMQNESPFSFKKDIDDENIQIIPNILITLIENTFKHGILAEKASCIQIRIELKNKLLILETKNSYRENKNIIRKGIGLDNLKARLSHIYQKYSLETMKGENLFTAVLKINL